jgi:hypothetical protein
MAGPIRGRSALARVTYVLATVTAVTALAACGSSSAPPAAQQQHPQQRSAAPTAPRSPAPTPPKAVAQTVKRPHDRATKKHVAASTPAPPVASGGGGAVELDGAPARRLLRKLLKSQQRTGKSAPKPPKGGLLGQTLRHLSKGGQPSKTPPSKAPEKNSKLSISSLLGTKSK